MDNNFVVIGCEQTFNRADNGFDGVGDFIATGDELGEQQPAQDNPALVA